MPIVPMSPSTLIHSWSCPESTQRAIRAHGPPARRKSPQGARGGRRSRRDGTRSRSPAAWRGDGRPPPSWLPDPHNRRRLGEGRLHTAVVRRQQDGCCAAACSRGGGAHLAKLRAQSAARLRQRRSARQRTAAHRSDANTTDKTEHGGADTAEILESGSKHFPVARFTAILKPGVLLKYPSAGTPAASKRSRRAVYHPF
jgi:hypothetical protein